MANLELFFVSSKAMNPALTSSGVELSKGFLGTKLSSKSRPYAPYGYSAKISDTRKHYPSISCSGGAPGRGAAVAVGKETKVGKVDVEEPNGSSNGAAAANGAANRASQIRDTILQEPKISVYDLDPPGPRSVHDYMEQVCTTVNFLSPFPKTHIARFYIFFLRETELNTDSEI